MAYNSGRLSLVLSSIEGQAPSIWSYITADTLATVKGSGYFSDASSKQLRIGDLIIVSIGTLNTAVYPSSGASTADVGEAADFTAQPQTEFVQVSAISSGAATVVGMAADLGTNVIVGDAAASTVGFYGTTPTAQPHATAESTVATTAITTLVTTPTATDIATAVNSLIARVAASVTLVNQLQTDLVSVGLIKGSN